LAEFTPLIKYCIFEINSKTIQYLCKKEYPLSVKSMVLGIFNKKKRDSAETISKEQKKEVKKVDEIPRIFLIDFDPELTHILLEKELNVKEGSLGKKIHIPNSPIEECKPCLLNYTIPENLHEYQIVIINLQDTEVIEYDLKDHVREMHASDSESIFTCCYPQTLFDPRPICGSWVLREHLQEIFRNGGILIVFSNIAFTHTYHQAKITTRGLTPEQDYTFSNYGFTNLMPNLTNKFGKEMKAEEGTNFTSLLKRYLPKSTYNVIFVHPTIFSREANKTIPDPGYLPLIRNMQDEVVSFVRFSDKGIFFLFPDIKDKSSFLVELLTEVLPSSFYDIFTVLLTEANPISKGDKEC
jgi:hypothetical protein